MNWKLRLKNKTTLVSLTVALITCVYAILSAMGITPQITEGTATDIALAAITALCTLGIVVDPTTAGVGDSATAQTYTEPGK